MTVHELLQQAQSLSDAEKHELARLLLATTDDAWTEEELAELLSIEPMTGEEIVAAGLVGGWKEQNLPDGAEWVINQRLKRQEKRK